MRKFVTILLVIFSFSCSSEDESNETGNNFASLIIGAWYYETVCEQDYLPEPNFEFFSDGTVSANLEFDGRGSGTYQISDGVLELVDYNAYNDDDRFTIESLNDEKMVWSELRNGERVYSTLIREEYCGGNN